MKEKLSTKSEQIKFLTDRCLSLIESGKTTDKIWENEVKAHKYKFSKIEAELNDIYKQIALIYLREKKATAFPPF